MTELPPRIKRTGGFLLIRLPVYLAFVLVLYVLSIGPMYWYWYESYVMYESHKSAVMNANRVSLFYLPLVRVCEDHEYVGDYVNWYLDFWI